MFRKSSFFIALSLFLTIYLEATVERQIDEKKPLAVSFSRISHNRVVVEGGSIEKVIGDSSIFSVSLDSSTGQAFITLLQDILRPATLTVITSSGFVQDLLVLSKDCPSEQVILKEEEETDWGDVQTHSEIIQESAVIKRLDEILEGKIPIGYGESAIENAPQMILPSPLISEAIRALEGVFQSIIVYRIKNTGQQTVNIDSEALQKAHHDWVFLSAHKLTPNQEAICLAAYQKDGH